jgi:branched-chain amino acid transport system ATP-binding protein
MERAMTEGPMLEVRGLHAAYGQTRVLEGVDLTVRAGELVVVIGPNGHGKTTLLRTISGLVEPSAGEVTFDGERIDGERPERIAMLGLVHIPQGDLPFADMTVEENLLLGAFPREAWRGRAERLERVYGIFPPLSERRTNRAGTLSGGERRMLALGRGLMREAKLLMLDEPSLGLAPVIVNEVYRHIEQIVASGMTLLLVEENFSHVQTFDARVLLLESGRVVREGSVGDLLADEIVMATYLGT